MSDFTRAIISVMEDREITNKYPLGLAPAEILNEVWKKYPGQFWLCTVIDVCHEKDEVMAELRFRHGAS